ncbi:MAG: hypothetical protein WC047_04405 [Kiritimatiellales bacterium]
MASFTFEVDPQFVRMMQKMANIDEIAPKMLSGAIVIVSRNVGRALNKHVGTYELMKSMRVAKPSINKWGWYVFVAPTGMSTKYIDANGVTRERKVPIRNAEKLAYMEWGTKNQAPTPILTNAMLESEASGEVERKMQEIFEQEVLDGR